MQQISITDVVHSASSDRLPLAARFRTRSESRFGSSFRRGAMKHRWLV